MNLIIDPVAFYVPIPFVGWWPIYWYGVSWVLAILTIHWVAKLTLSNKTNFSKDDVENFLFYGVLGAVIGGRVGYMLFYGFDQIIENPFSVLRVWEGGLSFHGGLIGILFSFYIFCKKTNLSFFEFSDHIALSFPLGLGIVRIGNFLGGELLGRPTDLPWGIIFWSDPLQLSRHPSQIYQAFSEGPILFFVMYLLSKKDMPRMAMSGSFLSLYGIFRVFTEQFRSPDSHIGFDLFDIITRGQLLSMPMILIGFTLILLAFKKNKNATIS